MRMAAGVGRLVYEMEENEIKTVCFPPGSRSFCHTHVCLVCLLGVSGRARPVNGGNESRIKCLIGEQEFPLCG